MPVSVQSLCGCHQDLHRVLPGAPAGEWDILAGGGDAQAMDDVPGQGHATHRGY